jgi:hypothetical protein
MPLRLLETWGLVGTRISLIHPNGATRQIGALVDADITPCNFSPWDGIGTAEDACRAEFGHDVRRSGEIVLQVARRIP